MRSSSEKDAPEFIAGWRGWDFRVYIGVTYLFGSPWGPVDWFLVGCVSFV